MFRNKIDNIKMKPWLITTEETVYFYFDIYFVD